MPDADREWQAVRRRQHGDASRFLSRTGERRHNMIPWLAVPFAAAAALAFTFFVAPESARPPAPATTATELAASPAGDASTVVYLDEKSGWLVVWASAAGPKHI